MHNRQINIIAGALAAVVFMASMSAVGPRSAVPSKKGIERYDQNVQRLNTVTTTSTSTTGHALGAMLKLQCDIFAHYHIGTGTVTATTSHPLISPREPLYFMTEAANTKVAFRKLSTQSNGKCTVTQLGASANPSFYCGDLTCNTPDESCPSCSDCGICCGDGICNGSETKCTCAADCGATTCGDGVCCNSTERCSCAADCGNYCGNGRCDSICGETACTCEADCGECGVPEVP